MIVVALTEEQWSALALVIGNSTADEFTFRTGVWEEIVVPAIREVERAAGWRPE